VNLPGNNGADIPAIAPITEERGVRQRELAAERRDFGSIRREGQASSAQPAGTLRGIRERLQQR
jgi:hypothetical protein